MKTTLALSASTFAAGAKAAGTSPTGDRQYYELRSYHLAAGSRLKADANPALLDRYLEAAMLPALDKLGIKNVGAFTEVEVDKDAVTLKPKPGSPVWVLIPHANLDSFVRVSATLNQDPQVKKAGADYLEAPKASPAFERFDSWLLVAFKGMPQLEVPAFSRNRTPTRVFELRDYESHSELMALSKIAMFEDGEIDVMKDLGMSPVFYGQALAGPDLPHLRYMTGGPDLETHLNNWKNFGSDPRWTRLKGEAKYADNTSRNTARFLIPKPYSRL